MKAKQGVLHDYDLTANAESSAQLNVAPCVICGAKPVHYQWSDYFGEAMCTQCGCPYQLKGGTDEQKAEDKYPYLNLQDHFIPIFREYWEAMHTWTYFGLSIGPKSGLRQFNEWYKKNHPKGASGGNP